MEIMAPLYQIEHLMAWNNLLTGALDFSPWPTLKILDLSQSQVRSLDITNNTGLTSLILNYNNLTYLDLSQNRSLLYLASQYNSLTGIDIQSPVVTEVYLTSNDIETIDLSAMT